MDERKEGDCDEQMAFTAVLWKLLQRRAASVAVAHIPDCIGSPLRPDG